MLHVCVRYIHNTDMVRYSLRYGAYQQVEGKLGILSSIRDQRKIGKQVKQGRSLVPAHIVVDI